MAEMNWSLFDTQMPGRIAAIPQQIQEQGVKNALAAIQVQQGVSQNKLAGMQIRQAEENMLRQNQLRALAPQLSGKKPEEVVNLLMANGFRDEAMKAAESYAKVRKDEREERGFGIKAALDKSKFYLDRLPSVNSREGAASWLAAQYNDPDLGRILQQVSPLDVELQSIPTDPAGLEDWKRRTATDMATYRKNNEPKVVGTSLMTGTGQVLGTAPAPAVAPRQPNPVADLLIPDASGRLVENTPLINAKARVAAAGRQPAQAPAPSLATIADPTDPTKAIVINTRQYTGGGANAPGVIGAAPPTKTAENIREEEQKTAYNTTRILSSATSISNILKKAPGASQPGAMEASAASVFGDGGVANLSRSGDRQIVAAAQADIIDSLLYLATGAAYNKEQLAQQRQSYLPAWSDKPETVEAKREALRNLIDGAKIRAGRAWTPKMEDAMQSLVGGKKSDAALSPTDQQALDWATANPKDPRSAQIKQRLGR